MLGLTRLGIEFGFRGKHSDADPVGFREKLLPRILSTNGTQPYNVV